MKQPLPRIIGLLAAAFCLLPASGQWIEPVNYNEDSIPAYTLPDLLTSANGQAITTASQWEETRRPEVLELITREMFGRMPAHDHLSVTYNILETASDALDGTATRKQVEITFAANGLTRRVLLLLYLPNAAQAPSPVFLGLNFGGNQTVGTDPAVIRSPLSDEERASDSGSWALQTIIDGGYGLATAHYFDFYPDADGRLADSIYPLLGVATTDDVAPDCGQAIAAWAWGLSRLLDYLETDPDVDATRVIVTGHSRLAKTALWAGASDPRFAIVAPVQSGCGGAAISRRKIGETVGLINSRFPHWFCKNYHRYNLNEAAMPFDEHYVLSLVAPRPLYLTSAIGDRWSDPKGEFIGTALVGQVYELYGYTGLGTFDMPPLDTPIQHRVAYHVRSGEHTVEVFDWLQFIAFADKWLR